MKVFVVFNPHVGNIAVVREAEEAFNGAVKFLSDNRAEPKCMKDYTTNGEELEPTLENLKKHLNTEGEIILFSYDEVFVRIQLYIVL